MATTPKSHSDDNEKQSYKFETRSAESSNEEKKVEEVAADEAPTREAKHVGHRPSGGEALVPERGTGPLEEKNVVQENSSTLSGYSFPGRDCEDPARNDKSAGHNLATNAPGVSSNTPEQRTPGPQVEVPAPESLMSEAGAGHRQSGGEVLA